MSKNTKFLYGKRENLESFIRTGGPLWFRDLYSLKNLENDLICDDESLKRFCIDSKHIIKITIDGHDFQLVQDSEFNLSQPTRRCHVLCLSNDGNEPKLFRRFKADICIEINVNVMIKIIDNTWRDSNVEVKGKEVSYFKKGNLPETLNPFDIVFKKNSKRYRVENEYRIAIFWPFDHKTSILTKSGDCVNIFGHGSNCHNHIELHFEVSDLEKLIINVKNEKGEVVQV